MIMGKWVWFSFSYFGYRNYYDPFEIFISVLHKITLILTCYLLKIVMNTCFLQKHHA